MKKKVQHLLFYSILVVIFFNCASIGPPTGGPADIYTPYLLEDELSPLIRTGISKNQRIILPFNERILPSTAINALRIEPQTDISIRIRNHAIYIKPKDSWPDQFKVFISRNLSDYNGNKLEAPIELFYSLSDNLVLNNIPGLIFNSDSTKIYELALLDTNLKIISKTEVNSNGEFNFLINSLDSTNIILAVENRLSDNFINEIRIKKYGISNRIINDNYNPIYISDPIYRAKINNVNLINNKFGEIILSDGDKKFLLLNSSLMQDLAIDNNHYIYRDYSFIDSINIDINMLNQIETYNISDSFILNDQIIDTLSAGIDYYSISNDSLLIKFTEPVIIDNNLNPFYSLNIDSTESIIGYKYLNPKTIYINDSTNKKINIHCNAIKDLNDNNLCDSILSIHFDNELNFFDNSFGEINGTINYKGPHQIVVEVMSINDNESFRKELDSNYFIFNQLLPGDYKIFAYENINPISDHYFSGTLEPLKKSAKFTIYDKILYVRANWSNTISLELK